MDENEDEGKEGTSEEDENVSLGRKITVTVKTLDDCRNVEVDEHATVSDFKRSVANAFHVGVDQLRLIFAGKVLKDHDTLREYAVKDGLVVHLIIRQRAVEQRRDESGRQEGGIKASSGFLGSDPEMAEMRARLFGNLLAKTSVNNPELARALLCSNPQMQQLMEQNPMINQMLNNPETIQQVIELVRNPSRLEEMMRSNDIAMRNIESIPGGYSALESVYRNVQEPMLDAVEEQFCPNPFALLATPDKPINNSQQGTENKEPLPNPWIRQQPSELPQNLSFGGENFTNMLRCVNADLQTTREGEGPTSESLMAELETLASLIRLHRNMDGLDGENVPEFVTDENRVELEQRYGQQLVDLMEMGFTDKEQNLRALVQCRGDVNAAIEVLLLKRQN